MGVQPGRCGQKLLTGTPERVAQLSRMIGQKGPALAVDGGVTRDNASILADAGATQVVVGAAFFSCQRPKYFLQQLGHE
jgi:ribulose-phosphate 3-epimerase